MPSINMSNVNAPKLITNAWLTAVYRAMNKTMSKAKTEASKKVREVYNIKAKDLNPRIKKFNARRNKLQAGFYLSEKTGLKFLFFNPIIPKDGVIEITFKRNNPGQKFPHAFYARMPSGHINIFTRIGKSSDKYITTKGRYAGTKIKRQKIKSMYSVDAGQMFNKVGTREVEKIIKDVYPEYFVKQLEYEFSKIAS